MEAVPWSWNILMRLWEMAEGRRAREADYKLQKREQKPLKIQRDAGWRVLASETFWPPCKNKSFPKPTCPSVKIKTLQKRGTKIIGIDCILQREFHICLFLFKSLAVSFKAFRLVPHTKEEEHLGGWWRGASTDKQQHKPSDLAFL